MRIFCWNKDNVSANVPQHQVLVLIGSRAEPVRGLGMPLSEEPMGQQRVSVCGMLAWTDEKKQPGKSRRALFLSIDNQVHSLSMLKQSEAQ